MLQPCLSYLDGIRAALTASASRVPPRPLAGQRLEAAAHQLEAWESPPESSWKLLGAIKTFSGELLESLGASLTHLRSGEPWGRLGRAGGSLGGVLGGAGGV